MKKFRDLPILFLIIAVIFCFTLTSCELTEDEENPIEVWELNKAILNLNTYTGIEKYALKCEENENKYETITFPLVLVNFDIDLDSQKEYLSVQGYISTDKNLRIYTGIDINDPGDNTGFSDELSSIGIVDGIFYCSEVDIPMSNIDEDIFVTDGDTLILYFNPNDQNEYLTFNKTTIPGASENCGFYDYVNENCMDESGNPDVTCLDDASQTNRNKMKYVIDGIIGIKK